MSAGNAKRMTLIVERAKRLYDPKKKNWTEVIKKASKQLKKEGKI